MMVKLRADMPTNNQRILLGMFDVSEADILAQRIQADLGWTVDIAMNLSNAFKWSKVNPFGITLINATIEQKALEQWFKKIKSGSRQSATILLGNTELSENFEETIYCRLPKTANHSNCLMTILKRAQEHMQLKQTLTGNEKFVVLGQLMAGAAHELNNSLMGIIGYSGMVLNNIKQSEEKEDVVTIFKEAKRCQQIVKGLLSLGRESYADREIVHVDQLIESVLEVQQFQFMKQNIKVVKKYLATQPSVLITFHKMQQVLINIIINALQAMQVNENEKIIQIDISANKSSVSIHVKDNGPGFDILNANQLFQPFYTTKSSGEGTGLGLSICKDIIEAHDGRIYARSAPGKGAEFIIEIPVAEKYIVEKELAAGVVAHNF